MFTKTEKRCLSGGYFAIIREDPKFIEVESKCTSHRWMIFKKTYDPNMPVVLYHKHSKDEEWYHEQCRNWTVRDAVRVIKQHDSYVVTHPNYLEKKRKARYYARKQSRA